MPNVRETHASKLKKIELYPYMKKSFQPKRLIHTYMQTYRHTDQHTDIQAHRYFSAPYLIWKLPLNLTWSLLPDCRLSLPAHASQATRWAPSPQMEVILWLGTNEAHSSVVRYFEEPTYA